MCPRQSSISVRIKGKCPEAKWFEYLSLGHAIPKSWKLQFKEHHSEAKSDLYDKIIEQSNHKVSITSFTYNMLIEDNGSALFKYFVRWNNIVNFTFENYQESFKHMYDITKVTKYRDFQYRLLLGKIVCNEDLFKWGLRNSSECTFCDAPVQTIIHLMVECPKVASLYDQLQINWQKLEISVIVINPKNIILNCIHSRPGHAINFVILFVKHYVYVKCCTNGRVNVYDLERQLEYYVNICRFNSK